MKLRSLYTTEFFKRTKLHTRKMKIMITHLILFTVVFSACLNNEVPENAPELEALLLTIRLEDRQQAIHGFGASDAWSTQFVGKNWPLEKREKIADLLFSSEMDADGYPMGIGLSIWRFNIGAGSARQGDNSGIGDPWRRAESFLAADSTYNWSMQQGQQWFVEAAHKRGVDTIIGFVNSPPVLLTKTGRAYGDGSTQANISSSHYDDFADYLARIAQYFEEKGMPFTYISPVNEPQWDWSEDNGQEGSPYQNEEIAGVVEALDRKVQEYGLDVQIEIPETARIDFLYAGDSPGRNQQSEFFFGAESNIKQLPGLAQKMAAHSYFTTYPVEEMIEQRQQVWENIRQTDPGLEYWMTEFCVLGDVGEGMEGNGRDLGIDPALYVTRVMHYDLTIANASSWQWWLGVSPYDYKDGLVYIDDDFYDGEVYDSKLLWGIGNYSRFIKPGSVRVEVDRSDQLTSVETANGVMASAYFHDDDQTLALVAINYGPESRKIEVNVEGIQGSQVSSLTPYVTSKDANLERQISINPGESFSIPARSIVTLTTQFMD